MVSYVWIVHTRSDSYTFFCWNAHYNECDELHLVPNEYHRNTSGIFWWWESKFVMGIHWTWIEVKSKGVIVIYHLSKLKRAAQIEAVSDDRHFFSHFEHAEKGFISFFSKRHHKNNGFNLGPNIASINNFNWCSEWIAFYENEWSHF